MQAAGGGAMVGRGREAEDSGSQLAQAVRDVDDNKDIGLLSNRGRGERWWGAVSGKWFMLHRMCEA